jgi:threonylcarbamoyladenosine tRNA methylthiotransferase MtaB
LKDTPIWFHTFGCKANQYDTERMRQELEGLGGARVSRPDEARVAVVNTCTVTNQADADARHLIRRLRRDHPDLKILVAGCSAALREPDYEVMPEVDGVVPGQDPAQVAEALTGLGVIDAPALGSIDAPGAPGGGMRAAGERGSRPLEQNARGTRAWLKVQDGCDRKCSFCATRLARGTSRSRPIDEIVREAELLAAVHPELVITGIHIGHYGHDLDVPSTLARLCERLLETVPARLRLSSIEATEVDDQLVGLVADSGGQLAPHLHVPLQSGSDRVLKLMRRWHTRDSYARRVEEIAERVPRLGLGADVIVGFPGEGEAEFGDTRALIEALPFTYLHVFPYSARDGTVAASLPDAVPGNIAAARSRELREAALRKGQSYRDRRTGERADVVVEGMEVASSGLTGDYLRVEVRGDARPGDRFETVIGVDGDSLYVHPPAVRVASERPGLAEREATPR